MLPFCGSNFLFSASRIREEEGHRMKMLQNNVGRRCVDEGGAKW
jgi:hypothetical protein